MRAVFVVVQAMMCWVAEREGLHLFYQIYDYEVDILNQCAVRRDCTLVPRNAVIFEYANLAYS